MTCFTGEMFGIACDVLLRSVSDALAWLLVIYLIGCRLFDWLERLD